MRTTVRFFVSYAHADALTATTFLKRLTEQLAPSKRYQYNLWRDTMLLVGERWHDEIQQALGECQMGLLLVSPAFLASDYIVKQELPRFLGQVAKPVLPVMLQPVDFQRHDLKGLEHHQIFCLDKTKAFGNCGTNATRRRFVAQLFGQIEQRLDRLIGPHTAA